MHIRYRLENNIGVGGMGAIYRAYDSFTGTWVALKQLHLDEAHVGATVAAVETRLALAAEFRLLANLRHPHIVSVLDYGFEQAAAFFTMEYLPTATPFTAAATQPLATRLQLLAQLLQALEYVRRHGVVHRDLKPENVLVQQGQVKVLDFGLAILEGQTGTSEGSLFYMAPEAFNVGLPLTHATDLFAVGIMAYEILAGQHPFAARNVNQAIEKICQVDPDYTCLAGPAALRPVIARLLAKKPAARFASAHAALVALNAASDLALPLETPATRASLLQAAQFVGREAERAQLHLALTQAQAGQGSVWWVGGESGVGKSRLLDELRIQALVCGVWVWPGQATHEGGSPPQLWRTILRWLALSAAPTLSDLEAGVLWPFIPDLAPRLGRDIVPAPPLSAQAAGERFCNVVLALIQRVAAHQPLLFILEDLHWADPLSRIVLTWLMRVVASLPLLVVGTYRDDEEPLLPQTLPPAHCLPLKRLPPAQIAQLASAILGRPPEQLETLTTFLWCHTDGNALFVVEVLRSLAEEAGLLQAVLEHTLPGQLVVGSLQQVIQRRLQQLAPADYAWVELAAVAGRDLDMSVLQAIAPEWAWPAWLSRCAEAGVLEPQGAAWRFAHDQLRQSVLTSMVEPQKRTWHLQLAETLERVYAHDLTPHLPRLAQHYAQTENLAKQREYFRKAGDAAQQSFAAATALDFYNQLLPLLTNPAEQFEVHLMRGQVLELTGAWQEAEIAYRHALTLAEADPTRTVQVQYALGKLCSSHSDYPAALAWLAQAQAAHATLADPVGLAQVLLEIGGVLWRKSEYVAATHPLHTGLALLRAAGNTMGVATALGHLGIVAMGQGDYAAARALFTECLTLRRDIADKPGIANTLNNLGIVAFDQGDYATARALYTESLALRRAIGDWGISGSLNNLGNLAFAQGDYAEAQALHTESLALRRAMGDKRGVAMSLNNLSNVAYMQGDYPTAWALGEESLARWQELEAKSGMADALFGLGLVALAEANPAAGEHLLHSLRLRQASHEQLQQAANLVALAHLALRSGQATRAAQLLGTVAATLPALNAQLLPILHELHAQTLAALQVALTPTAFAAAWATGESLTLETTVAQLLETHEPPDRP